MRTNSNRSKRRVDLKACLTMMMMRVMLQSTIQISGGKMTMGVDLTIKELIKTRWIN